MPATPAVNDFTLFVFETYGLMAPQTVRVTFLYRLADFASSRVDTLDLAFRDSRKANKGRLYTKWARQLSLARIKTVSDRLFGAARDARSHQFSRPDSSVTIPLLEPRATATFVGVFLRK